MSIAVIIPWRDRKELAITLDANRSLFDHFADELVISNCGGNRAMLCSLLSQLSGTRPIIFDVDADQFNKCLAANVGAAASSADTYLFLDADIILSDIFFRQAITELQTHCVSVLGNTREAGLSLESPAAEVEFEITHSISIRDGSQSATVATNRLNPFQKTRLGLGVAMIAKSTFLAIGGYNANLSGWGWEDVDLLIRAQLVAGRPITYVGQGIHLTHGDEVRDLRELSREESEIRNYQRCLHAYMCGDYQGTYQTDSLRAARI